MNKPIESPVLIRPHWNEYLTIAFYYRERAVKLSDIARAMTRATAQFVALPAASVHLGISLKSLKRINAATTAESLGARAWKRSTRWSTNLEEAVDRENEHAGRLLIEGRRPGAEVPVLDFLWSVKVDDPFEQVAGFRDGTAVLTIHTDVLRGAGIHAAKNVVPEVVKALADLKMFHQGVVEIESGDINVSGNIYTGLANDRVTYDVALNDYLWCLSCTDSREVVRKVTWGLFLGNKMASRFQAGADRAAAFVAARDKQYVKPLGQYVIKTGDGGLFFAMCDDPLSWGDQSAGLDDRATPLRFNTPGESRLFTPAWLHHQLRTLNMLM